MFDSSGAMDFLGSLSAVFRHFSCFRELDRVNDLATF